MDEYTVEIALEIIQLKKAKLLNEKQISYKNFKEELEKLNEIEKNIYNMDIETIKNICNEYKNEIKNGGCKNEE